jgi:hypothetical protein
VQIWMFWVRLLRGAPGQRDGIGVGYELHITRASGWAESQEHAISREEWERFARQDARLREEGLVSWSDIGDQPVFVLAAHDGIEACLSWREDCVDVWGMSDEAMRTDLPLIADALGARLAGDEGERYLPGGGPEDPEVHRGPVPGRSLSWRGILTRLAGRHSRCP